MRIDVATIHAVMTLLLAVSMPANAAESNETVTFRGPAAVQGPLALKTIYKVKCDVSKLEGTGFLYRTGVVVTAKHVVEKCTDVTLINSQGIASSAIKISESASLDLAAVRPKDKIVGPSLPVSVTDDVPLGTTVTMWGFPGGYAGNTPLLSLGFVAGYDVCQGSRNRMIINGAINHGLSGGPIINTETGQVIGVSIAKIIPLTESVIAELQALGSNPSGMQYTASVPGRGVVNFSEAQLTADVASYLASQVQLVVGCAVTSGDLRNFVEGL